MDNLWALTTQLSFFQFMIYKINKSVSMFATEEHISVICKH